MATDLENDGGRVAEEEWRLRQVAALLSGCYGDPRLGNKTDPVDELVYIILSRKTREDAYQSTFDRLKDDFSSWDEALDSRDSEIRERLESGGLGAKKTRSIRGALEVLRSRFGACTLEPARGWSDEELFDFLCDLPEIGPKSAYCIMMFSFGRTVLPVDTHVGRALVRIGPFRQLGVDLHGLGHKKLQNILPPLVPPDIRYALHVNLVAHGRQTCKFQAPRCGECHVKSLCAFAASA